MVNQGTTTRDGRSSGPSAQFSLLQVLKPRSPDHRGITYSLLLHRAEIRFVWALGCEVCVQGLGFRISTPLRIGVSLA